MGFLLKPGFLETATNAADVQRLMKSDLKNNTPKRGVKFVAAKHCLIGGKLVQLFMVTDAPGPLEAVIKAKHPEAYRAKGSCDLDKAEGSGAIQVTIISSSGQMLPAAVAALLPEAVGRDKNFVARVALSSQKPQAPESAPVDKAAGIPQWAREDFGNEAKTIPVMVSMTPGGEIGSLYFEGDGRIRTTHGSGPTQAVHTGVTTVRYNILTKTAKTAFWKVYRPSQAVMELFELAKKDRKDKKANLKYQKAVQNDFQLWVKKMLAGATPNNVPKWAQRVSSLETVRNLDQRRPSGNTQLVEIFKRLDGKVTSHFSRGMAGKIETDEQTLHVLREAISHIDRVGPDGQKVVTDPAQRNLEFYNFLKARLPNDSKFMQAIRPPNTIATKKK